MPATENQVNQPQLPAYSNRPNRRIVDDATSGLGATRPPHISRAGNRFTLVDASGNTRPHASFDLDVVIVDANPAPSRMYFDKGYDPANPDPPACWSDNGTGPSSLAARPQAPTCAVCPQAAWGSAMSKMDGKPIPACSSIKKLAVIVVDDNSGLVFEFVVPPGSWNSDTGWKRYTSTLKQHGVDVCDVVTRISFVPNSMGILSFQPRPGAGFVEGPLVQRVEAAWASGECPKVCGMLDVARDPSLPLLAKPVAQGAPRGQMPPPPQAGLGYLGVQGQSPANMLAGIQGGQLGQSPSAQHSLSPSSSPQSSSPATEALKPRGRPRKEPAPAAQPSPPSDSSGGEALDIPPFLQRAPQALAQQVGQQALPGGVLQGTGQLPGANQGVVHQQANLQGAQFGLRQAPPPDASLQKALADAFNLPTDNG